VTKQFSLLEIASAVVLLANVFVVVADLSGVFHAIDSATLQSPHRCTPAPHGMPAALRTSAVTASSGCFSLGSNRDPAKETEHDPSRQIFSP